MKKIKLAIGNWQLAISNSLLHIACCLLFIVYLSGCDKIEGNHFQPVTATDTSYTFPTDTTPNVYRVLLEDYTGHTCGNCPAAAYLLYNTIVPTYGDKLVAIGVHAGFFAKPCPPASRPPGAPAGSYADDFNTDAGTAWYNFFGFSDNPEGLINRIDYPSGTEIKTPSIWNSELAGIINDSPKVKIRIHNIYNSSTRVLQTFSETKFLKQLSSNYKINVVLSEDSILAWQLDDDSVSNPNIQNYAERHVLRGSVNGSWGDTLSTPSTVIVGTKYFKGYDYTVPLEWNINHVHVVVFVYDDVSKEILNVAEEAIVE